VQVVCPADAGRCKGDIDLYLLAPPAKHKAPRTVAKLSAARNRNGARIGRTKFSALAGAKPFVGIRLNRRGRRRILRHRRKTRARMVVSTRSATGRVTRTTRTITLAPRRAAHRKGRRR
jgi:hypothetical protein